MLHSIVSKLCDLKLLKICQNLHANMEGLRRASHKYLVPQHVGGLKLKTGSMLYYL